MTTLSSLATRSSSMAFSVGFLCCFILRLPFPAIAFFFSAPRLHVLLIVKARRMEKPGPFHLLPEYISPILHSLAQDPNPWSLQVGGLLLFFLLWLQIGRLNPSTTLSTFYSIPDHPITSNYTLWNLNRFEPNQVQSGAESFPQYAHLPSLSGAYDMQQAQGHR
ncbi:uncharacterized protein [Malus domestica]|uniref:uncharacterized protein n=1 Tax=Malus domestica TaxID=3750 RepID=UPI0039760F91